MFLLPTKLPQSIVHILGTQGLWKGEGVGKVTLNSCVVQTYNSYLLRHIENCVAIVSHGLHSCFLKQYVNSLSQGAYLVLDPQYLT